MKCKQVPEYVDSFLDGMLDEETSQKMREHLSSCTRCRRYVLNWEQMRSFIEREKTERMKPFFYTRFEQRLSVRSTRIKEEGSVRKILQPALIMILLFLSLTLGLLIGSRFSNVQGMQSSSTVTPGDEFYLNESHNEIESILLAEE